MDQPSASNRANAFDRLMKQGGPKKALIKGWKIFSQAEIDNAKSPMEKQRREFWNKKAEQLAEDKTISKEKKATIYGLIDVSWTLRKTTILQVDVNDTLHKEELLIESSDPKRPKKQKKATLKKNLERMMIAQEHVQSLDDDLKKVKTVYESKDIIEKEKKNMQRSYTQKKQLLDGAYTELKRAQDAVVKALATKRKDIEKEAATHSTAKLSDSSSEEEMQSPRKKSKAV